MQAQASELQTAQKPRRAGLYYLLAFMLPALTMGAVFALWGVYPFGTQSILAVDLFHQYFPFLRLLQDTLREGGSPLWSWHAGLGTSLIPLYAYYLASPLNLLLSLAPAAFLREALTVSVALRAGLAGLCCAYMLRHLFDACDLSLVVFGVAYALCGFLLGYFANTIWLDTFALLPLVVLGAVRLLRGHSALLYAVMLALSIWCSFLIGLYVCIFMVLLFVVLAVLDRVSFGVLFRRLARMAVYSLLAVGVSAVLLIPTYLALQNTLRIDSGLSLSGGFFHSLVDLLSGFAPLNTLTNYDGLPNVFSGMLAVVLMGLFFATRHIRLSVKACAVGLLAILLLSLNWAPLYRLWNAMQATALLPGRFAFLVTLVLVVASFAAMRRLDTAGTGSFVAMAVAGLLVALCAALGPQPSMAVWAALFFAHEYVLILWLLRKQIIRQTLAYSLLLVLVVAEFGATAYLSADDNTLSPREPYYVNQTDTQALVDASAPATDTFYRMEMDASFYFDNSSALYGYPGAALYASTANGALMTFLKATGSVAAPGGSRYSYVPGSPLTDALLAMRYYIVRAQSAGDTSVYWQPAEKSGSVTLYENQMPLALGYMVEEGMPDWQPVADNPFATQNALFRAMTGLSGDLFTQVEDVEIHTLRMQAEPTAPGVVAHTPIPVAYPDPTTQEEGALHRLSWVFTLPEEGVYYAYIDVSRVESTAYSHGARYMSLYTFDPGIHALGEAAAGDVMRYEANMTAEQAHGTSRVLLARIDQDLFARGYERLATQQLQVTSLTDTRVEATIDVTADGLLYTSIPYDKGWRAYVDGTETEITPVIDAMVCIPLATGTHALRFVYWPQGLTAGLAVSAASVCGLALLLVLSWRKRRSM